MKLQAEISREKHEIDIRRNEGRVSAEVDGRTYDLEVSEPEPGVYLIKNDGRVHEVSVSPDAALSDVFHTHSRGGDFTIKLTDRKRLRGVADVDGDTDGPAEIKTAMPGKVVRLLVVVGAEVVKGDGIVVVEAMKMQNELKSPKDGIVKELRVAEGSTVAAGETLATVE